MGKLNITQEALFLEYTISIDELTDTCDWITHITGEMVCGTVVSILLENNVNVSISSKELYKLYDEYIKNLNLADGEWREKYGVPEIIKIIYEILEKKAE